MQAIAVTSGLEVRRVLRGLRGRLHRNSPIVLRHRQGSHQTMTVQALDGAPATRSAIAAVLIVGPVTMPMRRWPRSTSASMAQAIARASGMRIEVMPGAPTGSSWLTAIAPREAMSFKVGGGGD